VHHRFYLTKNGDGKVIAVIDESGIPEEKIFIQYSLSEDQEHILLDIQNHNERFPDNPRYSMLGSYFGGHDQDEAISRIIENIAEKTSDASRENFVKRFEEALRVALAA
jgi:hypothetical protein